MNTIEGIIKDVKNGELVSKNVLSRVIELIGLEKWQAINDEHDDIITTTGELLIILENLNEMKSCEDYEAKVTKCKYCNGRGLVAIGENIKGLKECPYCDGTGLIKR